MGGRKRKGCLHYPLLPVESRVRQWWVWCLVKDRGRWMDISSSLHVERMKGWALHAVAKARLSCRLTVSCRCLVPVAVGLLRGHWDAGTCCQHQLGCACNRHTFSECQKKKKEKKIWIKCFLAGFGCVVNCGFHFSLVGLKQQQLPVFTAD